MAERRKSYMAMRQLIAARELRELRAEKERERDTEQEGSAGSRQIGLDASTI